MELLEKFAAVEIKADNCISEQDRQYCEAHQAAYEAALVGFRELAFFAADMKNTQNELLGPWKDRERFHDYLCSPDGPNLSQTAIKDHIQYLHTDHIKILVRYFRESYCVNLDSEDICSAVLSDNLEDRPDSTETAGMHEPLMIRYQSVVEQIVLRLDGRSFSEQSFYELCERCHMAAWNASEQTPKFEAVKNTVRFLGNFCDYECLGFERWKLTEAMRDIVRGAAHFESGNFRTFPKGASELLEGQILTVDFMDWPNSEKLKGLKTFKNGRVDLKFASEKFAQEFVQTYLGSLY